MKKVAKKIQDRRLYSLLLDRWAVHPEGQLGTCGFYPEPWNIVYVYANDEQEAINKAAQISQKRKLRRSL